MAPKQRKPRVSCASCGKSTTRVVSGLGDGEAQPGNAAASSTEAAEVLPDASAEESVPPVVAAALEERGGVQGQEAFAGEVKRRRTRGEFSGAGIGGSAGPEDEIPSVPPPVPPPDTCDSPSAGPAMHGDGVGDRKRKRTETAGTSRKKELRDECVKKGIALKEKGRNRTVKELEMELARWSPRASNLRKAFGRGCPVPDREAPGASSRQRQKDLREECLSKGARETSHRQREKELREECVSKGIPLKTKGKTRTQAELKAELAIWSRRADSMRGAFQRGGLGDGVTLEASPQGAADAGQSIILPRKASWRRRIWSGAVGRRSRGGKYWRLRYHEKGDRGKQAQRYHEDGGQQRAAQRYHEEGGQQRAAERYHEEGGQQRAAERYHEEGGQQRAAQRYKEAAKHDMFLFNRFGGGSARGKDAVRQCGRAQQRRSVYESTKAETALLWGSAEEGWEKPPPFTALDDEDSLEVMREFVTTLGSATFVVCNCCWKGWYCLSQDPGVSRQGRGSSRGWFALDRSEILEHWQFTVGSTHVEETPCLVRGSRLEELVECVCGARGERVGLGAVCASCGGADRRRRLALCVECLCESGGGKRSTRRDMSPDPLYEVPSGDKWDGVDHRDVPSPGLAQEDLERLRGVPVLGRRLADFAAPVARLSDFEEMVLGRVHPLVQVYTIPRTGELAYVGHICNFRQDVSGFMTALPVRPQDTPFVLVRPRGSRGSNDRRPRAPFRVDVAVLREAFAWLKAHNGYYRDVDWDEDAAREWQEDDPELPCRDCGGDAVHEPVQRATFERWMEKAAAAQGSEDESEWRAGRQVLACLGPVAADRAEEGHGKWFPFVRRLAEFREQQWLRAAESVTTMDVIAFLELARGEEDVDSTAVYARLRGLESEEWTSEMEGVIAEICAVRLEEVQSEDVVAIGALEDLPAHDEEGARSDAIEALRLKVQEEMGQEAGQEPGALGVDPEPTLEDAPGEALRADSDTYRARRSVGTVEPESRAKAAPGEAPRGPGKRGREKYPRVPAPRLATGPPLQENTPGYIAMAFPKLFPHGTGDYHESKGLAVSKPSFIDWGRHLLQWHDGRFMRHTRFRYWLLNTWLRMKTPGVKEVFLRVNPSVQNLTAQDLKDPVRLRTLVQQMSTVSSNLPGTVGERRVMRQRLEALVEQKEAESMEFGHVPGAGRLPAGFATFTVAVYKWEQLHEIMLRSYCPEERERLVEWKGLPRGEEREQARARAYYKLAVENPGVVAWYSALRLEMMVHAACALLTRQVQSDQVPGKRAASVALEEELRARFEHDDSCVCVDEVELPRGWGQVDDHWATFEWSSGGMVHVHVAFWIVGAPRIDGVLVRTTEDGEQAVLEKLGGEKDEVWLENDAAAKVLTRFYSRVYTEWNNAKPADGSQYREVGKRRECGKGGLGGKRSPDMIMEETVLWLLQSKEKPSASVLEDLEDIICGGRCAEKWPAWSCRLALGDTEALSWARVAFASTLVEWTQMHDFHEPFPAGPPGKQQSCAKVDDEFSSKERVECGKLFPRAAVGAGQGVVSEDPRRGALYRLWLSRNCAFVNNYVPQLIMLGLSNMDFQAVTTKYGVVEYMTKYMSKAGQGSMVKVMEEAFSKCMHRDDGEARPLHAAIGRFFNLAAAQEVKSQLETMHLLFGLPRYLCSREFSRMSIRTETKRIISAAQVDREILEKGRLTRKSRAEVYAYREQYPVPDESDFVRLHPVAGKTLEEVVKAFAGGRSASKHRGEPKREGDSGDTVPGEALRTVPAGAVSGAAPGEALRAQSGGVADSEAIPDVMELQDMWKQFLRSQSWWQFTRAFRADGGKLLLRPAPDVVVVSPLPRIRQAAAGPEYEEACRLALIAFVPWPHPDTFESVAALDKLPVDKVTAMWEWFVTMPVEERERKGLCGCPSHLQRDFYARAAKASAEGRARKPAAQVRAGLAAAASQVLVRPATGEWRNMFVKSMGDEEQKTAEAAWRTAEREEEAEIDAALAEDAGEERKALACGRRNMRRRLRRDWNVSCGILHDACLSIGVVAPERPSLLGYFGLLETQLGNSSNAFLPQNRNTHKRDALVKVIGCLQTGKRFMGGVKGCKRTLAERLETHIVQVMVEGGAGYDMEAARMEALELEDEDFQGRAGITSAHQRPRLAVRTGYPAELPGDAYVTAAQAESSLGKNQADDMEDLEDFGDKDLLAEARMLSGVDMNPPGLPYECLCLDFAGLTAAELERVGSPDPTRKMCRNDFAMSVEQVRSKLKESVSEQERGLAQEVLSASAMAKNKDLVAKLDPTQRRAYDAITHWADEEAVNPGGQEPLRLLLLGTAGTGKTQTVKAAVQSVRERFGSFGSVLMVSHTGVAAVNLGAGASTIDSLFKTGQGKFEDLDGDALEELLKAAGEVRLLIIDEISMVSAAQFEMMSRRLEQVGLARYRLRHGKAAPDSLGGFGGIAVVCVGDFGQLPPVGGASLIDASFGDRKGDSLERSRGNQGQRRFMAFEKVISLRRVYRQKEGGAFKDSTLRLRDGALTLEDLELWKTHELRSAEGLADWDGAGELNVYGVQLVLENEIAGEVNGRRLLRGQGQIGRVVERGVQGAEAEGRGARCRKTPGQMSGRGALTSVAPLVSGRGAPTTGSPGHKISSPSEDGAGNEPAALVRGAVLRATAWNSSPIAARKSSKAFRGLRGCLHYSIGCPVMYTQNRLADVQTVPLGIMNGARGVVVAALYPAPGSERLDHEDLGALGDQLGLPEMVVVHFPTYTGKAFFPGLPVTWVPVLCSRCNMPQVGSRLGLPLRLCWALTVHKAQGLTLKDGCLLDFRVGGQRNPVESAGLAFVGCTRAEGFEKQAFFGLPSLEAFVAMRRSKAFKLREVFEGRACQCHDRFLEAEWKMTVEDEVAAHLAWKESCEGRPVTAEEAVELREMLVRTGVAPLSKSVEEYLANMHGGGRAVSLAEVARSFKQQGKARLKEGMAALAKLKRPVQKTKKTTGLGELAAASVQRARLAQLVEMQFEPELAREGLRIANGNLRQAVLWCQDCVMNFWSVCVRAAAHCIRSCPALFLRVGVLQDAQQTLEDALGDPHVGSEAQVWSFLAEAGFDMAVAMVGRADASGPSTEDVVTAHARLGRDGWDRQRRLGARRACATRTESVPEPSRAVYKGYELRAKKEWPDRCWKVRELGIRAGGHTNACMWLSIIAGWSRCRRRSSLRPDLECLRDEVEKLRGVEAKTWHGASHENTNLGDAADRLREAICGDINGYMREPGQEEVYVQAYAATTALAPHASVRDPLQAYRAWLTRVRRREFADELVLTATAKALGVCIVTVPKPKASGREWALGMHPVQACWAEAGISQEDVIVVGNDDVHYVWLEGTELVGE